MRERSGYISPWLVGRMAFEVALNVDRDMACKRFSKVIAIADLEGESARKIQEWLYSSERDEQEEC